MLGRRLDRYIGSFFVWHFVLCLAAVLGLYVVIDTFAKLDEFAGSEGLLARLHAIVSYHAYQVPVLLSQFLPVVTLLAGIISFARLARYNELNAIKAAGVSMHRSLAPVFLVALLIGGLGAANQELLVPAIEADILNARLVLKNKDVYKDLFVFDRAEKTTVWVRQLDDARNGFELTGVAVEPKAAPADGEAPKGQRIRGAAGAWVGHWLFLRGGETLTAEGAWAPLGYRALLTGPDAATYDMPRKPKGAAEGPAEPIDATHDGVGLGVSFDAHTAKDHLWLMTNGQLTGAFKGARTIAPTAIQAAVWTGDAWLGKAQSYRQINPRRRDEVLYDGEPLPLKMPPQELIRSNLDPTLKSFSELLAMAREMPNESQKILVVLHNRVAIPFASFVLLLVAIPLLFQQEGGKSTWAGVGIALLVSMGFYVVNYAFQIIGQTPNGIFDGVPALAAWLPIILFTMGGVVLTARMNT